MPQNPVNHVNRVNPVQLFEEQLNEATSLLRPALPVVLIN